MPSTPIIESLSKVYCPASPPQEAYFNNQSICDQAVILDSCPQLYSENRSEQSPQKQHYKFLYDTSMVLTRKRKRIEAELIAEEGEEEEEEDKICSPAPKRACLGLSVPEEEFGASYLRYEIIAQAGGRCVVPVRYSIRHSAHADCQTGLIRQELLDCTYIAYEP